ncbi:unnamed protein product, partial [Nippostrongylus brasiliensis]|uniref:AN1-type zinc finger protein 1 (inferred by orthology to a human protein) n=1 Tax=Nippostrongylus brasiliensis TaxID=27835 RepID=A0A0N4YP71_NIPBR
HGCDGSKQYDPSLSVPSSSGPVRNFLCSYAGCSGAESIKIVCPHCERNFCLKHRHADEHSCENLPEKTAESRPKLNIPAPAPSAVPENVLAKPKPVVNLSDADRKKLDRILIMKLKMNAKATGDVPVEERIFLFVEGDHFSERKAIVVSKTVCILKEGSDVPLDYAESISDHVKDMDTIIILLV